jgi:nickel superoxide dismutase
MRLARLLPARTVYAHCDLPCGVYDPAQARIEAQSVHKIMQKYAESTDEVFRLRSIIIKEERAELVKRHLWVLWTDYFKPEHVKAHPEIHDLFWRATKQAGTTKHSVDPAEGEKLLSLIDEIAAIFAETKKTA